MPARQSEKQATGQRLRDFRRLQLIVKVMGLDVSATVPPPPYISSTGCRGIGHRDLNRAGVRDHATPEWPRSAGCR